MKDNKLDVFGDLMDIQGDIIALEAMFEGKEVTPEGVVMDYDLSKMIGSMEGVEFLNSLRLGTEAAINKSLLGRVMQKLNVFFTASRDDRMQKRIADLNLINTGSIIPGPSTLKYDKEAINLFLNAWGYISCDPKELEKAEALRVEFMRLINEPDSRLGKALGAYLAEILVGFPIAVFISVPIGIGVMFVYDVMFWYYIITCLMICFQRDEVLAGTRPEFAKLITQLTIAAYKNGSGKTITVNKDGKASISDLQKIKEEVQDATMRMRSRFEMNKNGTLVEYKDKVEIAKTLRDSRLMFAAKYTGHSNMNSRAARFYNIMSRNFKNLYNQSVSYDETSIYLVNVAEAMAAIMENSILCDKYLTTIIRGLYKM